MNEHVGNKIWRKTYLKQILLLLLVTNICVISVILLKPGSNPRNPGYVMKTVNDKPSGYVMKTVNNKTSGYVIKTAYGGKTAPLEFNFTVSDIAEIVKSWRNYSGNMKWKIVDILQMVSF